MSPQLKHETTPQQSQGTDYLNSSHSLTKSPQPRNLRICITSSLFNLLAALTLQLSLPSLDHQHHPHYVQLIAPSSINSLCLWNQLLSSFRQPHSTASVSVLPVHAPTTSPHSVNSPSITPSLSHCRSRPTSFTNLSSLRTDSTDFTTGPFLLSISVLFLFLVSSLFFFVWFRAAD